MLAHRHLRLQQPLTQPPPGAALRTPDGGPTRASWREMTYLVYTLLVAIAIRATWLAVIATRTNLTGADDDGTPGQNSHDWSVRESRTDG
ncbi:hypothetical protein GCM10009612_14740 [Streptomyces beijiangensis]